MEETLRRPWRRRLWTQGLGERRTDGCSVSQGRPFASADPGWGVWRVSRAEAKGRSSGSGDTENVPGVTGKAFLWLSRQKQVVSRGVFRGGPGPRGSIARVPDGTLGARTRTASYSGLWLMCLNHVCLNEANVER